MPKSYTVRDRTSLPRAVCAWKLGALYPHRIGIQVLDKCKRSDGFNTGMEAWLTVPVARRLIAKMTQMCNEIERDK